MPSTRRRTAPLLAAALVTLIGVASAACTPRERSAEPARTPVVSSASAPMRAIRAPSSGALLPGEALGSRFMVAADHPVASAAGAEILRLGGNAVDAAVAVSFTLSVVRPESCGIGGGGFMLIHLHDDPRFGTLNTAIDYRERAPAAATPDMFDRLPPGSSTRSGAAVAVPGTVAGLLYALDKYGTLDRATVMAPAVRAAREGFAVDRFLVSAWESAPAAARAELIKGSFQRETDTLRVGDRVRNRPQQAALELIARNGASVFTSGPIAHAIIQAVRDSGGIMTLDDLRAFTPKETTPIEGVFMGRRVLTMPPPSSGGIALLQILGTLERRAEFASVTDAADHAYVHLLAESMRHSFADRARNLADPEFVGVPVARLLDATMLDRRAASIDPSQRTPAEHCGARPPPGGVGEREGRSAPPAPPFIKDDHGTSHFSIIDGRGNAVACTETINLEFGSGIAVPGFGFCLNNEMDDFLTRSGEPNAFGLSQAEANLPAPGKRPLSSMTPTIVLDARGEVELVAGGSGGPRIISATAQAIINAIRFGATAGEAVGARRLHHQWMPDRLDFEPQYASRRRGDEGWCWTPAEQQEEMELRDALTERGHALGSRETIAQVQLIRRARDGAPLNGASDPRKGGRAIGE